MWKTSSGDRTIGPRPELLEEMKKEAGVLFYLCSAKVFINSAAKLFNFNPEDEVLREINNIVNQYNYSLRDEYKKIESAAIKIIIEVHDPSGGNIDSQSILNEAGKMGFYPNMLEFKHYGNYAKEVFFTLDTNNVNRLCEYISSLGYKYSYHIERNKKRSLH